ITYRRGNNFAGHLSWFDRSGKILGTFGARDQSGLRNAELSPNGHQVVATRPVEGNEDIWILDSSRMTRFTFDATAEQFPLWSPDGTRITFRSDRKGIYDLFEKSLGMGSSESLLVESLQPKAASDWSRDGRFLLYSSADPMTGRDIWVLPRDG